MIFDVIIVICAICAICYGIKKGCIEILFRMVSLVVALVLAYMLAGQAAEYIKSTGIGANITQSLQESLTGYIFEDAEMLDGTSNFVEFLEETFGKNYSSDKANVMARTINYIFIGIGFATVYILVRVVLVIAEKMLGGVFEFPILKTFNKLGGAIVAGVLFLIEVSIILAIASFLAPFDFMNGIIKTINSSVITKMIYDNNIITSIISNKVFK